MIRDSVTDHGLAPLIAPDPKALWQRIDNGLFEPMVAQTKYWTDLVIEAVGQEVFESTVENEFKCPLCLWVENCADFEDRAQIDGLTKQLVEYARDQNLITKVQ